VIPVTQSEVCPYSDPPFAEFTDDHIFPDFLGGRRTIRVCRDCNSRFGHSFEAESAKQVKQLQVFISHFGLDLTRSAATWPSALVIGDKTYDLRSASRGVQYELAHPVIRRDDSGQIVSGQSRSRREAEQLARNLVAKGKAKRVEIEESPGEILNDVKLGINGSFNPNLYRFATKLVANVLISMGRGSLIRNSGISQYLHGKGEWATGVGYSDTSGIRKLRPPLSHTVYIEFGTPSHAIVLIFGEMQIYVPLPVASPGAILGFLDPITGEESFEEVTPIGFVPPPPFVSKEKAEADLKEMLRLLGEEAKARGATHPPDLHLVGFDLGRASVTEWIDGTHKFLKKIT
jgi:HNH endonuclease